MSSDMSRRDFLATASAAAAGLALGCTDPTLGTSMQAQFGTGVLPDPGASGIEHVVVVMMENRSFDHFLGWLPGADGRQAGLTYFDGAGVAHATYPLAPDFQGCGHQDPDHSYEGGRIEYGGGACDGWLRTSDIFSIGYYQQQDLAFLGRAVPDWTSFDRYFCSIMAETYPNRVYQHAGQTDRLHNTRDISTLPTIWDRLAGRGLRALYYFTDLSFLALWGDKYLPISRPIAAFYEACASGTLPAVAFVEPGFGQELSGTGEDDHPFGDIRAGEAFMHRIYAAVTRSPAWSNTVLIINFDEWGGFFDHVPPPTAPIPEADRAAGNVDGLLGFRTPTVLISPFAPRATVSHVVYDHTSVLRLIEWRWGLEPLTVRDATANNLALELDFAYPNTVAPAYAVPSATGAICAPQPALVAVPAGGSPQPLDDQWAILRDLGRRYGWIG